MKAKHGHLLWITHLLFTTVHVSLIFFFFQIDLKLLWSLIIYGFVENFERQLLIIKRGLITLRIDEKSLKC